MDFLTDNTVSRPHAPALAALARPRGSMLLIGDDAGLQNSRRLLLERAGHAVYPFVSWKALERELPARCHLALICRSVGFREALWIAQRLHAAEPHLPILRFATGGESASPEFTAILREAATPPVLLAEIGRLLQTSL